MYRNNYGPLQGDPQSLILYIGLIPFEWSEENLRAVVCGLGNVIDVRLGFDYVGKNKGYAFVEFENPQQAQMAIQLLNKVFLTNPMTGQTKKLRTELSKEPFKSGNMDNKRVIPLNAQHLPPGVQFPPEVLGKYPQLQTPQANLQAYNSPSQSHPGMNRNFQNTPTPPAVTMPPNAANTMPEQYLKATQVLPQVAKLPFETPDKINETLSHISPPQLIELLAHLKNILSSTGATRAADVFQVSPFLAPAATQALLLMGLIDEEVIQEAMKAETQPAYQQQPPHPSSHQQQIHPQGHQPNRQQMHQSSHQQPQYGQQMHQNQSRPQNWQNTNLPNLPPPPRMASPQAQGNWPGLPLLTQMKLGSMPKDQADLIAQVLQLTPDQISSLPPDRQSMVAGIRQQYL